MKTVIQRARSWVLQIDGRYVAEFYTPYGDEDVTFRFAPDPDAGVGDVRVGTETMSFDVGDLRVEIVSNP